MSQSKHPHQWVPETWPLPMRWLSKLSHFISVLEGAGIAICLVAVIFLATWQFVDRNLFNMHLPTVRAPDWSHGVIRHSIFLLGFLGGAYATYQGRHIRIDALTRTLSVRGRLFLRVLTTLAALFIVGLLIYASWDFRKNTLEEAGEASQQGELFSSSRGAMIMVLGYCAVALHFFVQILIDIGFLVGKTPPPGAWINEDHGEGAGLLDENDPLAKHEEEVAV